MHSFGKMLKALPHHSRERSKSRERAKTPIRDASIESASGGTTATRAKWSLAPEKSDPTIINIKSQGATATSDSQKFVVSCSKASFDEIVEVSNPFNTEEIDDVKWMIEEFWRMDVLNREKALSTRLSLKKACKRWMEQLHLDKIVADLTSDLHNLTPTIFIEIEGELCAKDSIHSLPWELLEHHSLWPEGSPYDTDKAKKHNIELCVRRKATAPRAPKRHSRQGEDGVYRFEVSFSVGNVREQYPTFNILIIAARHLNNEDDSESHFQIARPLIAALAYVDPSVHFQVEVCRPGTWESFQQALARQKNGHFNVVHLDLPTENGNLHFLPVFGNHDPVPDSRVAEILQKHEVNTVFMTCNEEKPHVLARNFVAQGIPVVISAPFRLPKMYLMLMCSGYYMSLLFLHRKGPAYAAHVARRAMQNQDINHRGRYHVPIKNTAEGLGIIVFENSNFESLSEFDTSIFTYPVTDKTPARLSGVTHRNYWLHGRDLDILKIERRLLSPQQVGNVMWLTGKKGAGKTILLDDLSYWWSISRFIGASLYIDLGQCMDDFAGVLCQFSEILPTVGLGDKHSERHMNDLKSARDIKKTKIYKELVGLFKTHRWLLYFDNVDNWRPRTLNKTVESAAVWYSQKRLLLDFVEDIRGSPSFVLLVCPDNNRSIRGTDPVYELKPLKNHDVQAMYEIVGWDTWVPGTSSISTRQSAAEEETAREICDFHEAIVESSMGLMGARRQFVFSTPFDAEQRTRDIFLLSHSNSAGATGPYNAEDKGMKFLEQTYDLVIRDRQDLTDKSPNANPNILRLLLALSTFFERVPKDIDFYLVLLWHYGLFTEDWSLSGEKFDHTDDERDCILWAGNFSQALNTVRESPIYREWNNLIENLSAHDYMSPDTFRPGEYHILDPMITFTMRKIVYASEGPLTTPILPLAIRSAAQDYHISRYNTLAYGEDHSAQSRIMLEKHTLWSQMMSTVLEGLPVKTSMLIAQGPFSHFMNQTMSNEVLTASDRRVNLWIYNMITSFFDSLLQNPDFSQDEEFLDSDIMLSVCTVAYGIGHRLALYHNVVSGLPELFDGAVLFMRRCKAFAQRYSQERREAIIDSFDGALVEAEELRAELVSLGKIVDSATEEGIEPPPAYVKDED